MQQLWTTAELLERGRSERQIRRAVEDRLLLPVRKGLFAAPATAEPVVRAARVGGVLTGPGAAKELGLWTAPDPVPGSSSPRSSRDPVSERLHVAVNRRERRLRDPDDARRPFRERADVVVHRVDANDLAAARRSGIAPLLLVLRHVLLVMEPAHALAVLDSALHERHLHPSDLPALAAAAPPRLRPLIAAADGRAESGLESIVRYLLRLAGLRVEILVGVRGVGTVDLVVEGRLIVECDGKRFHTSEEAFSNDRRRDLVAVAARYRVLRVTWFDVLFRWAAVEAAVFAALAVR